MADCNENFSRNIRCLRRVHGLTQAQMADILGISTQTLQKLEKTCDVRINSRMLCRVCDRFGLSADALLRECRTELPACGTADPSA